jgi:hypothetical protein
MTESSNRGLYESKRLSPNIQQRMLKSAMEVVKRKMLELIAVSIKSGIDDEQIAEQLGISLDETHFHLDDLECGGFIKLVRTIRYANDETGYGYVILSVTPRGNMVLQGKLTLQDRVDTMLNSPHVNLNQYGSVGVQQIGNYNAAEVTQNIGLEATDITQIIEAIKREITHLPLEHQEDAMGALEDIREEAITPTRASRIKSGLLLLWSITKDTAAFANSVTALAQRFHLEHLLK